MAERYCTHCGAAADHSGRFCSNCGERLGPDSRSLPESGGGKAAPDAPLMPCGCLDGDDAPEAEEPFGLQGSEPAIAQQSEPPSIAASMRPAPQGAQCDAPEAPTPADLKDPATPMPPTELQLALFVQGEGNPVPIPPQGLLVGADPSCDLAIRNDAYVSARHATVTPGELGLILEDRASTNGTYVRVRGPVILKDGDEIRIGTTVLRVGTCPSTT